MKRLFFLSLMLMMALSAIPLDTLPTSAQDDENDSNWEVVALHSQTGQVFIIMPDGTQSSLAQVMIPQYDVSGFVLSPNRQYLAFRDGEDLLWIYNLETESLVYNILGSLSTVDREGFRMQMGAFSPDSSKFVVGFDFPPRGELDDNTVVSGLRILDISINSRPYEIVDSIDFTMADERYPSRITWDDGGIFLDLRTYYYQRSPSYAYQWNPETSEVTETDRYIDAAYNRFTDELVISAVDFGYPHSGSSGMEGRIPNTLLYFADAGDFRRRYEVDAQTIYYTGMGNESSMRVTWVNNGNGVLRFHGSVENTYLYIDRNGLNIDLKSIIPSDIDEMIYQSILEDPNRIASVTDGWLMYHRDTTTLLKFTVSQNAVEVETFGNHPDLIFLENPPNIPDNPIPFATIPSHDWGDPACEGFLPSRLTIGGNGWVIPGPANNVRRQPNSGGELLGTIEGGGRFIVLDGPVCDGSVPYWQVDYNGLAGWTAEGSGSDYWLEPQP